MATLSHPWDAFLKRIADADGAVLDALELEIFGRKAGALTVAMRELATATPEKKKELGKLFNDVKTQLTQAISDRSSAIENAAMGSLKDTDALDVTLDLPQTKTGHLHPIHSFIEQATTIFGRMGYDLAQGPEIETEDRNFTKLNIPPDHPARDMQDTFWVSSLDRTVLRTQTSSVQIHYMQKHKPPFRMICTGKVYRKDSDATHSPMFHQIEGLMIGRTVSLANMKGVMETAIRQLIHPQAQFRWRTGFFPFVEPGMEVDVRWQDDEHETKEGRWLEIVGCGMVHPNVLRNVGVDPQEWQGFAFGFGVERMIMIRDRIPDLRLFFQGDSRFLEQF